MIKNTVNYLKHYTVEIVKGWDDKVKCLRIHILPCNVRSKIRPRAVN